LTSDRNDGAGIYTESSPTIRQCRISGNESDGPSWNHGGGIHVEWHANPLIERNLIADNFVRNGSWNYGAGIYVNFNAEPDIIGNVIVRNGSTGGHRGHGAGIYVDDAAPARIIGNVIHDNTNESGIWNYGGGIYVDFRGSATFVNNTIVANRCIEPPKKGGERGYALGGGIYYWGDGGAIHNNIVASNDPVGVHFEGSIPPAMDYNDCWNNTGGDYSGIVPGPSGFSLNPRFASPSDLHITPASPCLDAGANDHIEGLAAQDWAGNPRLQDGNLDGLAGNGARVDIGADEFSNVLLGASGPPAIGTTIELSTTGTAGLFYALTWGTHTTDLFIDPYGVLLVQPLAILQVAPVPGTLALPLPPMPTLAGATLYLQSIATMNGVGNASNRLDLVLF